MSHKSMFQSSGLYQWTGFVLFLVLSCSTLEAQQWRPKILESSEFIPDYSFAGYYWGEQSIPRLPSNLNVSDFGAVANDGLDDTKAIKATLEAAAGLKGDVVIRFPKGRFILNDIVYIEQSDLVIQGAGSGQDGTVLYVPEALSQMSIPWKSRLIKIYYFLFGKRQNGKLYSTFSWQGGVIWSRLNHTQMAPPLDGEIVSGQRGSQEILISDTTGVKSGEILTLSWHNHEGKQGSLLKHIYGNSDLVMGKRLHSVFWNPIITQPVTVVEVLTDRLRIKEPLLHDLRREWTPGLARSTYLEGIGIEHLRIEFPDKHYAGHHLEKGYNAIYLTDAMHSWIRDVAVHNADSAILINGCKNVTATGVTTSGRTGHYSVNIGGSYGVLVSDFNFQASALHNPSFNTKTQLSVYSGGSIEQASLDQHRGVNNQNLFEDIAVTSTSNLFRHGSVAYWGPTAARYNTFWNIRILDSPQDGFIGRCSDCPDSRLVGIVGINNRIDFTFGPDAYIEGTNKPGLLESSLYRYQLRQRINQHSD